jgi:DHA1 family bicyclomycin/chloramphenicol resistance-like MFS transporter
MSLRPERGLIALLACLSMLGPFAIDTFFPAFPAIASALSASPFQMQQTLSVYLIAYGVMALVHGGLSDAIGRRPVILGALAVFTAASVGCAVAKTMDQLLFFRAIQGLSAGAGVIVGRAIVRDRFAGAVAQRVMSGISMLFGIAPAIAPIIGGYLLYFGWRSSFVFLVLLSGALMFACVRSLPETHAPDKRSPMRPLELFKGYLTMLSEPRFVLISLAGGFNFAAIFLYISSAPSFVMEILHLNERQFGAFFVPTIGGMVLGSFVSGRIAGKVSSRTAVYWAYAVMLLACVVNVAYTQSADAVTWPWAVLPIGVIAFSVAIVFPLLTLAMMDLFPARLGTASSLQMFLSLIVNAGVAGLLAPLLQHNARLLALGTTALAITGLLMFGIARKAVPFQTPALG